MKLVSIIICWLCFPLLSFSVSLPPSPRVAPEALPYSYGLYSYLSGSLQLPNANITI